MFAIIATLAGEEGEWEKPFPRADDRWEIREVIGDYRQKTLGIPRLSLILKILPFNYAENNQKIMKERERERQRERLTERERERQRQRQTQKEKEKERTVAKALHGQRFPLPH